MERFANKITHGLVNARTGRFADYQVRGIYI